jgi:hypothetical protein
MASKQVSAMLVPRAEGTLWFRCRLLIRFDAFSVVHLRSSLYSSHDVISSRLLTMTFTTTAFGRSSSWLFEACSYKPASKGLPSSPAQHHAPTSAFLTQPLHPDRLPQRVHHLLQVLLRFHDRLDSFLSARQEIEWAITGWCGLEHHLVEPANIGLQHFFEKLRRR